MNSPQLFKNEKYEIGDISIDAINTEKITKNININQLKYLDKVDKFLEKNFSKLIKKKRTADEITEIESMPKIFPPKKSPGPNTSLVCMKKSNESIFFSRQKEMIHTSIYL